MEFGSRSKRLRPAFRRVARRTDKYVQKLLCDPGIAAQPRWDLHRWKHWTGCETGQASMGYSVHSRCPPLRQAGRSRRSVQRLPVRSPMPTGTESFPFFPRLLHTTPFAAVENRQRAKTVMNVKLYRLTQAIMSLTAIPGGVTGIADAARLARRERTRGDSLRYCYPPLSFARAGAGARPMSSR
jgi:hypothetical protein